MIKVVKDFLPKPIFKDILSVVEGDIDWRWEPQTTIKDDKRWMFSNLIYIHPELTERGQGIASKESISMFGVFKKLQDKHIPSAELLKLKMNLNPNENKQAEFGIHTDILINGMSDPNVITSVFNFHTCNGYTMILGPDGFKEKVPSVANSIVMFDNHLPHFGVSQTDIPRRIILNMNVRVNNDPF